MRSGTFVESGKIRSTGVALLTALMVVFAAGTADAAVEQNMRVPLEGGGFTGLPCIGEDLAHTDGYLHIKMSFTENSNRISGSAHFQPQGAKLVGLTTGDEYVGTGMSRESFSESKDSSGATTFTLVSNFRILGKGEAPDLLAHELIHMTIDANGNVTAEVESVSIECG